MNDNIEILFVGTREAFCNDRINTSIFIHSFAGNILLDCGYSIPFTLSNEIRKKYSLSLNDIDVIYISHFHGDHTLGLPPILLRMKEEGRKKPLFILGQLGIKRYIDILVGLSYKNILDNVHRGYEIIVKEINIDVAFNFNDKINFSFCETNHSIRNLAVCLNFANQRKICYSGDGNITSKLLGFYDGASLLIHEAFSFEEKKEGHAEIISLVNNLKSLNIEKIALTHIKREYRGKKIRNIMAFLDAVNNIHNKRFFIPEDLEILEL